MQQKPFYPVNDADLDERIEQLNLANKKHFHIYVGASYHEELRNWFCEGVLGLTNGAYQQLQYIWAESKTQWNVRVRAIVSGRQEDLDNCEFTDDWENYDSSTDDGLTTLRFDTRADVTVNAKGKEDAIELAIGEAPTLLTSPVPKITVNYWVDEALEGDVYCTSPCGEPSGEYTIQVYATIKGDMSLLRKYRFTDGWGNAESSGIVEPIGDTGRGIIRAMRFENVSNAKNYEDAIRIAESNIPALFNATDDVDITIWSK